MARMDPRQQQLQHVLRDAQARALTLDRPARPPHGPSHLPQRSWPVLVCAAVLGALLGLAVPLPTPAPAPAGDPAPVANRWGASPFGHAGTP